MEPITPPSSAPPKALHYAFQLSDLLKHYRSEYDLLVTAFLLGRAYEQNLKLLVSPYEDEPSIRLTPTSSLSVNGVGMVAVRVPGKRISHTYTPFDPEIAAALSEGSKGRHLPPDKVNEMSINSVTYKLTDLLASIDPLGLISLGAPLNEYATEAREIVSRLTHPLTSEDVCRAVFVDFFSERLVDKVDFQKMAISLDEILHAP